MRQACGTAAAQGSVADRRSFKAAHGTVEEPISRPLPSQHWDEQPGLCLGSPEQIARPGIAAMLPPSARLLFIYMSSSGREDTIIIIFLQSLKQVTWPARGKALKSRGICHLGTTPQGGKKITAHLTQKTVMRPSAGDVPGAGAVSRKPREERGLGKGLHAAVWHRPSAAELSQAPALHAGAGTLGSRPEKLP